MEHDTEWYLEQYHQAWGALVYDGSIQSKPHIFSVPRFDNDLIEQLYCEEMIGVLTSRQVKVVMMRIEGFDHKTIAKECKCSCESVNQALVKARKRLKGTSLRRRS